MRQVTAGLSFTAHGKWKVLWHRFTAHPAEAPDFGTCDFFFLHTEQRYATTDKTTDYL